MRSRLCKKQSISRGLVIGLVLFMVAFIFGISCQAYQSAPTPPPPTTSPTPSPTAPPLPSASPASDTAAEGRSIFISKACVGCHTIKGIPEAEGKVGPELTHQASSSLIVGVLPNTEENLKKYLRDPAAVKPGALMPNQYLSDSEIEALVAFLRTLK